ncbi:MAG: amidohydrolase family protein [Lachnospiraceae bacterium]
MKDQTKEGQKNFVLRGNIIYSKTPQELSVTEHGFLVCSGGKVKGVYETLPKEYRTLSLTDYGDAMIIPGLTDLHLHAPQYSYRGTGMDLTLLDWLNTYTFPEEERYQDEAYARLQYARFAEDLKMSPTCRAAIFATIHPQASIILMDLLEKTGLVTFVGKVSMDRNGSKTYTEHSAPEAAASLLSFLSLVRSRNYQRTFPILTPRFTPACSDDLLMSIGQVQKQTGIPVQSHLSENPEEIAWVRELCPTASCYGDTYQRAGLFGGTCRTIMAHGVWCPENEIEMILENGVYLAHCPQSNTNIASGIAPIRKYLDLGMHVGLGSDVAGGASLSLFRAITDAIGVSKLHWRLIDHDERPLTFAEGFYLATRGGGSFFGDVGAFEEGFAFDALVLSEKSGLYRQEPLINRLEQFVYLPEQQQILAKYVAARRIF